jgi:hypothetical protein
MVSTCASCLSPIYPRRPICCGSPWQPPSCRLTSHLVYYPSALLLALPWPPCCDTLPPSTCTICLCRKRVPAQVTYMLTTGLCRLLPTCCQTLEPTPDRCIGSSQERLQLGTFFFILPSRPLQQLSATSKVKSSRSPEPEKLKRKECPAPLLYLDHFPPPAYSRLAPFGEKPAHKCHSRYPFVFGSTVRPLRSMN